MEKKRPTLDSKGEENTGERRGEFADNKREEYAYTAIDNFESACASANPLGPSIHRGQSISGAGDDLLQNDTNLNAERA